MKTQFVWLSDKGNNGGDVRTSSQEEEELEKISEINNFDRRTQEQGKEVKASRIFGNFIFRLA